MESNAFCLLDTVRRSNISVTSLVWFSDIVPNGHSNVSLVTAFSSFDPNLFFPFLILVSLF